jgi:acyl-CoA thioesterase-2
MDTLARLFELSSHGPDTFVGTGPKYQFDGLYGGHIVAQSLRAAAHTVDPAFAVHSLRAYFIRRGDHNEPIRFEVDRIRNGRGFITRRVVARQSGGAILNLEASFQVAEESLDIETVRMPAVPPASELRQDSWTEAFDRAFVPVARMPDDGRTGAGRAIAWMKANEDLGADQLLQRCTLAYISDDMPTDAVVRAFPGWKESPTGEWDHSWFAASLDHSMWFHRPVRTDEWHLYDFTCHSYVGGRGLALGHIFAADGVHVATVAQEVLVRARVERGA